VPLRPAQEVVERQRLVRGVWRHQPEREGFVHSQILRDAVTPLDRAKPTIPAITNWYKRRVKEPSYLVRRKDGPVAI
jgi:hypothetical protein